MPESKELSEVFTAIEALIADFRAKKPIAEIVVGNLPALETAIQGFDGLSAELKDKALSYSTIGYHVGKILSTF